MHTRREVLKLAGTAAGLAVTPAWPSANEAAKGWNTHTSGLAHGLFFDAANIVDMRRHYTSNPMFADLRTFLSSIDREAERRFIAEEVRYNDQLFDIVRLSQLAERMSFHYLMTGDGDAADLAAEAVRSIAKFHRWDYFLEAGTKVVGIQRASSTVMGVCAASDWLGDRVTDEERADWIRIMAVKGCEACHLSLFGMRYQDEVVGWTRDESSTYFEHRPDGRADLSRRHIIINTTNLKAVPSAALAVGAVTYESQFGRDKDSDRWIEMAEYSLGTFKDYFEKDGSYHEGVSYAYYTATQLATATTVLERSGRGDLSTLVNWPGYADYFLNLVMPTADDPFEIVNFGDNGNPKSGEAGKPTRTAVPFWVARTYHDGRAQWLGASLAGGHDLWSLCWYNESIEPDRPSGESRLWHSDLDWMVARTGFDVDDLTVAMRSGGPGNHEHADRNSIVLKCFGEQLVTDPYRPPYRYSDPSWMMRTTAGHSAVLVDGKGHQYHDGTEGTNPSDARAVVIQTGDRTGYCFWSSDATQAYQLVDNDISWVSRTVVVAYKSRAVFVIDKVEKRTAPSRLEARFFGYNLDGEGRVNAIPSGFETVRPNARLWAQSYARSGVLASSETLPVSSERAVEHPFGRILTEERDRQQLLVTVLLPSRLDVTEPDIDIATTVSGCRVTLPTAELTVSDRSRLPKFALEV